MRQKWIALGIFVLVIFLLTQDLFKVLKISTSGRVEFYLFLAITGYLVVNMIVPQEYKKWAQWIPTLCVIILLAIGMSSCVTSCKNNRKPQVEIVALTPHPSPSTKWIKVRYRGNTLYIPKEIVKKR